MTEHPKMDALPDEPLSEDAMPQGEARERAEEELDALAPGPRDPLHFGQEGVTTDVGEDPISDFTGRGNGP